MVLVNDAFDGSASSVKERVTSLCGTSKYDTFDGSASDATVTSVCGTSKYTFDGSASDVTVTSLCGTSKYTFDGSASDVTVTSVCGTSKYTFDSSASDMKELRHYVVLVNTIPLMVVCPDCVGTWSVLIAAFLR